MLRGAHICGRIVTINIHLIYGHTLYNPQAATHGREPGCVFFFPSTQYELSGPRWELQIGFMESQKKNQNN